MKLGQTNKAIDHYEQVLGIMSEIGDRRGEGNAEFNMAVALNKLGQRAQAIERAEAALAIFEAIEDTYADKVRRRLEKWRAAPQSGTSSGRGSG
jgi:tetratricopeptide (TPR) repeat protein